MRAAALGGFAILATGVGFGVRGGILANWGSEFGFTEANSGITGTGLTGFCFGIIIGGLVVDRLGYGGWWLPRCAACLVGVRYAGRRPLRRAVAYNLLYWGTFIFAVANGTLEAVANRWW
jgi:hypothetical protein